MQKMAMDELKEGKILKETKAYQNFMELCGGNTQWHLLKLSAKDIDALTARINTDPTLRRKFCKQYILKSIKFHTRKLNSGPLVLGALFHRINGFTGTTWNKKTYPEKIKTKAEKGTDAKSFFLLMGQPKSIREILVIPQLHPFEFLRMIPLENNHLALLDSAACLKGPPLFKSAEILLERFEKKGRPIKGIVIHDANGSEIVVERDSNGKISIVLLKDCTLALDERFTIFSKPYTTGADIPQSPTAIAYMTVGRDLILRDLLQTYWCMRKVDKGQQVKFIITEDVKKIMLEVLKKPQESDITLEDIIAFAAINQAIQIGQDNYLSMKQKMLEVIQETIREIILDPDFDPEDAAELCTEAIKDIFVPKTGTRPSELYSGEEVKAPSEDVLDKDIDTYVKMLVAAIDSSPILKKKIDQSKTEERIANCKDTSIVSEELAWKPQDQYGKSVKVQQKATEEQEKLL